MPRNEYGLEVRNGQTLTLPPYEAGQDKWQNLAIPDVYAVGSGQLYPTGSIFRKGIRTFVYSKWAATGTVVGAGYMAESTSEYVILTNAVISGAAGAFTVVITRAGTTVNQFAGGFLGIKMGTGGLTTVGRYSSRQIISNTVADGSDNVTFTLDGPNVLALTTADDVVLSAHPYAEVRIPQSANYGMCVGVLINTVVVSNYVWLQTGGPHNMIAMIATFEGGDPNSITAYSIAGVGHINEGGAAGDATPNGIAGTALQVIGYSYPSSDIGGPGGSPADISHAAAVFLTILN